jgi:hypothetical protein
VEEDIKEIVVLDVKRSHEGILDCPMRLFRHPQGYWQCIDCGLPILNTSMRVKEVMEEK